ncbi:MAG: helix-turn-helix domain containing protein [Flavobacteriaceae bacterium]|jgi:AcrR family transcriptional regulator|nr:helix-turn-helix domain containing protein [Flavobacteriaceae bacterium]|tara:strand:+ start:6466 stop:7110 length:645 start_codon:yes stop_codon:yes gene_type:complete
MSSLNVKRKRGRPVASEKLNIDVILEAALDVFSDHGYEGAQLKEVAQKVGVTTPLISYHFENKEDLWKKSIIHLSGKIMLRYEEVRKEHIHLKGIALLKAFSKEYLHLMAEFPSMYKVLLQEMGRKSWRYDFVSQHLLMPVVWFSHKPITESNDLEEFKSIPVANFVSIMFGATSSFFVLSQTLEAEYGISPFTKENIEIHANIMNDLIFNQFE